MAKIIGQGLPGLQGGDHIGITMSLAFTFLAHHPEQWQWQGQVTLTVVPDETVFGPDGAQWLLQQYLDKLNSQQAKPPLELPKLSTQAREHDLRLSVNTGTMNGGDFVSQSATEAHAEIDFRIPPGLSIADVKTELQAITQRIPGLLFRRIKGWEPNWVNSTADIVQALERAIQQIRGATPNHAVRLPASDASRWRAQQIPAVCYGPQPLLASDVDDFAYLNDVIDCAKIYALAAIIYLT